MNTDLLCSRVVLRVLFVSPGGERGGWVGAVRISGSPAPLSSGLGRALEGGESGAAAAAAPRLHPLPRPGRRLSARRGVDGATSSSLPPREIPRPGLSPLWAITVKTDPAL